MGASASVNTQDTVNEVINQSIVGCPTTQGINVIDITGTSFNPPPGCGSSSSTNITQGLAVDAQCALTNLISNTAAIGATLDATTQAGLGISANASTQVIESEITNQAQAFCGPAIADQQFTATNVQFNACNTIVTQNGTVQNSCQIQQVQDTLNKYASAQTASTTGGSFVSDVFGSTTSFVIFLIIGLVILICIGVFMYFSLSKTSDVITNPNTAGTIGAVGKTALELGVVGGSMRGGGCGLTTTVVVLVVIFIICLIAWFVLGRKTIPQHPRVDQGNLQNPLMYQQPVQEYQYMPDQPVAPNNTLLDQSWSDPYQSFPVQYYYQ